MRILRLQCYEQHYNWVVRKAYGAKHQSARQSSECGGLVEDELDSLALDARQGLSHAPRVLERATSLEPGVFGHLIDRPGRQIQVLEPSDIEDLYYTA